jgi:DNA-directed RNA polymerase subunit H (RpoH/RPB5)
MAQYSEKVQYIEKVFRSRQVILEILRERGYDTAGAEKFGPEEIRQALDATPDGSSLEVTIHSKSDKELKPPNYRIYVFLDRLKQKLPGFLKSMEFSGTEGVKEPNKLGSPVDPVNTGVLCLINEPVAPVFNQASLEMWLKRNLRLSFFYIDTTQMNPMTHSFVPHHELVPKEQHESLMKTMYVTQKSQFPLIRYHEDPITRVIGAVPGDILKITRSSPSSGEYVLYRVCVP